jgi:uncharacterized protein (TIGR03382 family)
LANLDTTPALEVFSVLRTGAGYVLQVLDGVDGLVLAESAVQPQSYLGFVRCSAANLDGQAGAEFVCVADNRLHQTNAHAVLSVKYTPSTSRRIVRGTLSVAQAPLAADATGALSDWGYDPLIDLDGDGTTELVISARDTPSAAWNALVLRATAPDSALATMTDQVIVGWTRTGPAGRPQLVTSNGGAISGWRYVGSPTPLLSLEWTLPARAPLRGWEQADWARQALAGRLVTLDFDGDGVDDLVTTTSPNPGTPNSIVVYSMVTPTLPKEIRRFALPGDAEVQAAWILPPVSGTRPQLAVTSNLGVLYLFDAHLRPIDFAGQEFLTGGFAGSGARSFSVADGGAYVFVVDSAQGLRRIDALGSSNLFPAQPIWRRPNTRSGGSIVSMGGEGTITTTGYLEPVTEPRRAVVRQLALDGGTRWTSAPIPGTPYSDPTPAMLDTDGIPDFAVQWSDVPTGVNLRFRAINGVDGGALWTDPVSYSPGAGGHSQGYACADWNGDGIDDIVAQGVPGTGYFTGTTGAAVSTGGGVNDSYFNPVLYDIDGNGTLEVILQSGYTPVKVLGHDFSVLYDTNDDDRPFPNGGVADCPNGARRFIQTSRLYPGALKVSTINGSFGFQKLYLAAGQSFTTLSEAKASTSYVGYLGETSVHSNLSGAGHPTALVGSDEGFLYGINPCTTPPTLEFAANLESAVGEPIFGDTDGDGNDDIIVGTADGYLRGLRQQVIAAPAWVWDTDPPAVAEADVDAVDTTNHLSAKWASVAGAVSYEVGVARAGLSVGTPAWVNVGNVTEATLPGLPLEDGAFYVVGVRALTASGAKSPDTMSNGVRVWLKCAAVTCAAKDACHAVGTCNRATGACSNPPLPAGTTCPGGVCDALGACHFNNGTTCAADAQCLSGHCADGVCCDSACDGACDACARAAGAAKDGTCGLVSVGAPGSPSCTPFVCGGASAQCPTSCRANADCVLGSKCLEGICTPLIVQGAACTSAVECETGFCVDGVCCNAACEGACAACAVSAGAVTNGLCVPMAPFHPGTPACEPYSCNGVELTCPSTCTSNVQCPTGTTCEGGACAVKQRGIIGFGCGCQGVEGIPSLMAALLAVLSLRRRGGAR